MLKEKKISMKEILFPEREKIKMNFEHHKRNLRFIKDLEKNNKEEKKIKEENEKLNEFNENYNENLYENSNENNEENKKNLFKMKMFENVPARYLKNTENWILNHNKMNKKLPQIKKLNLIHSKKKYNLNYKNKTLENKNINNNNNESLFEKYYVKMLKKNIHSNSQENLFYSQPIINNINSYAKKNKNYLPPIINIF